MVYRLNVWGSSAFISGKRKTKGHKGMESSGRVTIASLEFDSSELELCVTGGTVKARSLQKMSCFLTTFSGQAAAVSEKLKQDVELSQWKRSG
jgi:histone acetyltransferase (RNA polymerase elongator complex component)